MKVTLTLTVVGGSVKSIHELLCLAIHEQDMASLEALGSIVSNVGEVLCVDPGCTPFDMLSSDDQVKIVDYIDLGNDREDLKRAYAETWTTDELQEALGAYDSVDRED